MSSCPQTTRSPATELVLRRLSERFPVPDKPRLAPLDELVLTILSQSTTDENRDRAWRTLAARYPAEEAGEGAGGASPTGPISWETVLRATPAELEDAVRVAGLANQKAPAIHAALERLRAEVGRITLDHLEEMGDEEAIAYLTTFRGVGVKTAACVLCFSLRRPVLPVDTHVLRIARRLAWVPPRASADLTYATLSRTVSALRAFPHAHAAHHVRPLALPRPGPALRGVSARTRVSGNRCLTGRARRRRSPSSAVRKPEHQRFVEPQPEDRSGRERRPVGREEDRGTPRGARRGARDGALATAGEDAAQVLAGRPLRPPRRPPAPA